VKFQDKLEKTVSKNNSLLCVGLDPDPENLKGFKDQFEFNKTIIDQTLNLVCCYKPQVAFYSVKGIRGLKDLQKTIKYIRRKNPQIPIILDAKRGDVPQTAIMYAKEVFDFFKVDAVTVNPYMGLDSLAPFFKRRDKGIIVLCRTSNLGAPDLQDLKVSGQPLYIKVAQKVAEWNKKYQNLLMVVGATWPEELKKVREIAPDMTFLIPGIGQQDGDLKKILLYGLRKDKRGLIISSSRSIIYAQDPKSAALSLRNEINKYR
jgi:orotidine-5'-phosphate decarboxylase